MATWTQAQNAKTAEAELREFIVNTKGFSAYQELLKIRREIIAQRRKQSGRHRLKKISGRCKYDLDSPNADIYPCAEHISRFIYQDGFRSIATR
jgi:hypothetical protein